jgi:hypothetical protein
MTDESPTNLLEQSLRPRHGPHRKHLFRYIVEKECLQRRFLAIEVYCCGADHIANTSIVDVFILGDCPATNRNIRYNNGLPIVVMQY